MKNFNVLVTCASALSDGLYGCLTDNEDGVKVNVYAANAAEFDLTRSNAVAGAFLVPKISDPSYFTAILHICVEYDIDIIVPKATLELEWMAQHKEKFEEYGIKVSVTSLESLRVANNKVMLNRAFGKYMPAQCEPCDWEYALNFLQQHNRICVKAVNQCGGRGFAIVDDYKATDIMLFHRFGQKHYITRKTFKEVVCNQNNSLLLQEYVPGKDYTVSLLCDNGKVVCEVGYVGYVMEFGSIMYGEIQPNQMAFDIANDIVRYLRLDGNIGVDFILKEDGSVVLLEVNPRVNASLPFVRKAGCNLLYQRCRMLLGEKPTCKSGDAKVGLKMKKHFAAEYYF